MRWDSWCFSRIRGRNSSHSTPTLTKTLDLSWEVCPNTDPDEVVAGLRDKSDVDLLCPPNQEKHHGGWRPLYDAAPTKGYHSVQNRGEYHEIEVTNWYIELCGQTTNKIIQCFRCQGFGHNSEFCKIREKCIKCTCTKELEQFQRATLH